MSRRGARGASERLSVVALAAASLTGCLGESTGPPVTPTDTVSFSSVQVGAVHVCGLTTETEAYCWGSNNFGQLGNASASAQLVPGAVAQSTVSFAKLALGAGHSCAITDANVMYCWGRNTEGQVGVGTRTVGEGAPARVAGDFDFALVAAGGAHTCGLDTDGRAWCWGFAESGQLGNGASGPATTQTTPDSVRGGMTFSLLTAGEEHTCGLSESQAYCWGSGLQGQLGTDQATGATLPTAVAGNLLFAQIDAGGQHTCAVTFDGEAYCWGNGRNGQLGDGTPATRETPTAVAGDIQFAVVSAGGGHSCGLTADGVAYCWGLNASGQIGDGTAGSKMTPTEVATDVRFVAIDAGGSSVEGATCGLGDDGIVYCWGLGAAGQLGTGDTNNASTPVRVAGQRG